MLVLFDFLKKQLKNLLRILKIRTSVKFIFKLLLNYFENYFMDTQNNQKG